MQSLLSLSSGKAKSRARIGTLERSITGLRDRVAAGLGVASVLALLCDATLLGCALFIGCCVVWAAPVPVAGRRLAGVLVIPAVAVPAVVVAHYTGDGAVIELASVVVVVARVVAGVATVAILAGLCHLLLQALRAKRWA